MGVGLIALLLAACSRTVSPSPSPVEKISATLPADSASGAALAEAAQQHLQRAAAVRFRDGPVEVVVMPASAELSVVVRGQEPFTAAARRADQDRWADVVLNGMTYTFDPDAHRGGSVEPTAAGAHGQALQEGAVLGGNLLRPTTDRHHLVQQGGRLVVGHGNPGGGTGLSGATALLIDGEVPQNAGTTRLLGHPAHLGMPYTGIDHERGLLWVLVRKSGAGSGWGPADVQAALRRLGVEDALAWDGGDSAALVIDGAVLEQPAGYKDRSIPYGLRLSVPERGL